MDKDKMVWIRIFVLPSYIWGLSFFSKFADLWGSLIKCDDQTLAKLNMEEARICLKMPMKELINESIRANIDGEEFLIFIRE